MAVRKKKKKHIKRLIHNRTIDQAIKALAELSEEGYGNSVITVDGKLETYGFAVCATANISIEIENKNFKKDVK